MSDYIVVDEKLIDKLDELKIDNGKCIMLYAKILAMANNKGYTTAGNAYFGRILNLEDRQVRRHLNSLEAAGCITRYEKRRGSHTEARMIYQGAKVDMFGVGERLITAKSEPVFGGVYKLAAVEDDDGNIQPKIKISENVAKITTPHFKKLYRIYDKNNHKAVADLLCVHDEVIDESRPLTLFDPQFTWKKKVITNFEAKPIQQQIFKDGKCVYKKPAYEDIVKYAAAEIDTLWDEITRFENPHTYYVDLSQKLWEVKNYLLAENNRQTAD